MATGPAGPGGPARLAGRGAALGVLALLAAAGGAGGWMLSDRMERENDFCNRCHLEPGVPLHDEIRRGFERRPAASLAAAHAAAEVAHRDDPRFRCIDCHGGTGALGRARVKLLAARDAFWYAVGRFEEPDAMRWPLWDADCRKCHADLAASPADVEPLPFHARPVHNSALGVACVECHLVHEPGGTPETWFLHAGPVRAQCARCHSEFQEEPR